MAIHSTHFKAVTIVIILSIAINSVSAGSEPNALSAKTAAQSRTWEALRYGMYIHFSLNRFVEENHTPRGFNLPKIDADIQQWVSTAKASGMTYAVLVVKHEDGFCFWDSKDYDNDIARLNLGKDIIAEFITECKKAGIKPGVHYSIWDKYNEGTDKINDNPVSFPYFKIIKQHIEELLRAYPDIFFYKFDGARKFSSQQRHELYQLITRLNPNCVVFLQDGQLQQGLLVSNIDAVGLGAEIFKPRNGEQTVIGSWFWSPQGKIKTAVSLFEDYKKCRQMKINFLLNVGPAPTGRIPKDQLAVLAELKQMIDKHEQETNIQPAGQSSEERLKKLKKLYDSGLITKEAYETKQKEILDSL